MPGIRAALIGLACLDLQPAPERTLAELDAGVRELMRCRRCEYADAALMIAPLLRDLESEWGVPGSWDDVILGPNADGSQSKDHPEGLRLLTLTTYTAAFVLKYLGFVDLSLSAAERCHNAARELGAPEWVGLAGAFATAHASARVPGRRSPASLVDC